MASVNKVILVGNLGRDPEIKYMPNGDAICNFSIATTSSWKDKDGNKKEETEWHSIVAYKRLAEIAGEYLKKGRPVYIEGRLKTRKWQDKATGADKFRTEVMVDQLQLLGGRESGGERGDGEKFESAPAARRPAATGTVQRNAARPDQTPNFADMDQDIPF